MNTPVVIYLHDPEIDRWIAGENIPSPSSVLLSIAGIVSAYAARNSQSDAAETWAMGMIHVPFVTPAGQRRRSRTIDKADADPLMGRMLLDIATAVSEYNARSIPDASALEDLSERVGDRLREDLRQSGEAALLVVVLVATSTGAGAVPSLKIGLADRTVKPAPADQPDALVVAEAMSSFSVDYGGLAFGSKKSGWTAFVKEAKRDDVTGSPRFLSVDLAAPDQPENQS